MNDAEAKPPRVKPRLTSAPKIRQIYWCDFWKDAHLPEMWKTRPVVVVSYRNTLLGICMVLPFSSEPANDKNPWACPQRLPGRDTSSWAICNQPSSVAVSRLVQFATPTPRLTDLEFAPILTKLLEWLPKLPVLQK
jgi:mRNA interferase MazF